MSDINLLPEELRSEEEKELTKGSLPQGSAPVFHLPQAEVAALPVIPAPSVVPLKEAADLTVLPNSPLTLSKEEYFKAPPLVKRQEIKQRPPALPKKQGFLGKLFSQKIEPGKKKKLLPDALATKEVDVNLIPAGFHLLPSKTIYTRLVLWALAAFLLVALGLAGAIFYERNLKKQQSAVDEQLTNSQERFEALKGKERELTALNDRLLLVKDLFGQHLYWTKFFGVLEKITVPEVYYTKITAAADGSVSLSAFGENYLALARQYLAYQQAADVLEANIAGISGDPVDNQVGFEVNLLFAPTIYLSEEED